MSGRREFTRKQRAQIVCRATDPQTGKVRCEGCGLILGFKPYEIDHVIAEALIMDKSRPLTIEDGKLLGRDCCHKPKTANDVRTIRKSDRVRDRHTGASRKPSRFACSRDSGLKRTIDGRVIDRATGKEVRPR